MTIALNKKTAFDKHADAYDRWFDENQEIYKAEVNAMQRLIPQTGLGLEVGVGTGRFAAPLGIRLGVEPSRNMALVARSRNIAICLAVGEHLPFANSQFDFAVLVTVVCFVKDVTRVLREARRVIKDGGKVIIAFIAKDSALGALYASRKDADQFYREAHFYTAREMIALIQQAGLDELQVCQTITGLPHNSTTPYQVQNGYGAGAFVVVRATKPAEKEMPYEHSVYHQ